MALSRGQAPGIIRPGAAASPYAALGNVLYESVVNPTFPADTGIVAQSSGTIGARVLWTSLASGTSAAAGSGARSTANPGVVLYPLANGAMRGRAVDDTTAVVQPNNFSGTIVIDTWYSVLMTWTAAGAVIVRTGAAETSDTVALNGTQGGKNLWIGTSEGIAAWDLVGDLQKAVMYDAALDATGRADLIALLDAEGP